MLRAYGITDKGRVRATNQDCFAVEEPLGLFVVADGMGGHNAGEVAARMAVGSVVGFIGQRAGAATGSPLDDWPFGYDPSLTRTGNLLRTAIHLAHVEILETGITALEYAGMGTTIVAVMIDGDRLSVGHVGDSRLYVVTADRVTQVTCDDSWMAAKLADDPRADLAALRHHPMRGALTNTVGVRAHTTVHVTELTLEGGEVLVLSTDGVHGVLDDRRLQALAGTGDDPRQLASSLVDAAMARGSLDNCTAVVARYAAD
jgi:serine/threonine protein phosphatase PrpC